MIKNQVSKEFLRQKQVFIFNFHLDGKQAATDSSGEKNKNDEKP